VTTESKVDPFLEPTVLEALRDALASGNKQDDNKSNTEKVDPFLEPTVLEALERL